MTDAEHQTIETVEPEGVNAVGMLFLMVGLLVVVAGVVIGAVQLATHNIQTIQTEIIADATYPALREARANAQAKLLQYAAIDGTPGKFRIPIERAMDLMVNEARLETDQPKTDAVRLVR